MIIRKHSSLFATFCCLYVVGGNLQAQQDIPEVNKAQLLQELAQLKETQEKSAKASLGQARQQIEAAAASPAAAMDFYAKAYMATQIVGKNRENTEFRDWKKREEEMLDSGPARQAVQMHLTYLGLSLSRASGVEVKDLLPDLVSYCAAVGNVGDLKADATQRGARNLVSEMLDKPLTQGVFVRLFQVGDALTGLENWEMSAGNVDGIVEKTVLPEMRQAKDPRVLEYWEDRIAREQKAATESDLAFRIATFENVRKPELMWSRAKEFKEVGLPNRAVTEMFVVLQKYPSHKDAGEWIAEIELMLNPPAPEVPTPTGEAPPVAPVVPAGN